MEWITGLITNVQELPGVAQKAHNAPFLAGPARPRWLPKLQDSEMPVAARRFDDFNLSWVIATNSAAHYPNISSTFVDFWAHSEN